MSSGSSTPRDPESTARREHDHWPELFDAAAQEPKPARRGVGTRGERLLDVGAAIVVMTLVVGWVWSFANARSLYAASADRPLPVVASVAASLTHADAPTTAYLTDATLLALTNRILDKERGASGKLRAAIEPAPAPIAADSLPAGGKLEYSQGGEVASAPKGAGIWNVLLAVGNAVRPVANFNVITMLPFSAKQNGRIGTYFVGSWPGEHGASGPKKAPSGAYGNPSGFIEVTQANADTPVSEHFKLRDFLTHDQPNVWPKYLVLQPREVDKLELVLADLQAHGLDVHGVHIMSGFRSPQYNYTGGTTAGRANLSRHMFGDASDIYIDSDGDGQMDDLNHDGKISIDDARVIQQAVDRVEAAHPELVGGAGVYTAAPGHGPFIHIDTRGYRARWSGTSGG
ncbi:MAG TPA: hypothetical protein VH277_12335 [Gemmatimonadaceae bacterium]|nr:hypothetical protein [Gemmatimonadaceae bacterium]